MYETNHTSERLKLLFKILIPVLIYQLANFSAQFIDTVMTGQYRLIDKFCWWIKFNTKLSL